MAPLRLLAALACLALAAGCGGEGDGDGQAPPPNVTLDAYASHNDAVEVQEKWDSDDPKVGDLCTKFYNSPNLADSLRHPGSLPALKLSNEYFDAFLDISRAELAAADACAEGTALQPWHSDEFEQELEARKAAAKAQELAASEAAAVAIDEFPGACPFVHDKAPPLRAHDYFDTLDAFERGMRPGLEKLQRNDLIPNDVDLDKAAEDLVFTCSTIRPEKAAEALRNPDTPTDELDP